jgi:thermitase
MRRIQAPHAWNVTKGDPSVVVAVIDQGVELNHPDLNLHPDSWNATFDLPDGSPTGNHGTACAGIVAARIDNNQGVVGVAGRCRIMAIATSTWADIDIAEGLYFAADYGAKVVSMSFGVYPSWGVWDFNLIRDAMQYALERGLVLIAASGNENISTSRFPGSDARTICVGGTNREDLRKAIGDTSIEPFWGACYGTDLNVVAPCLEIPTTDRLGAQGYSAGDYFDRFNGTSSATPHVAGLAGLIFSVRSDLSNEEVREIIETTCDKVRPGTYNYTLVGHKPNDTWNDEVGYGLVNAERAVLVACDYGKAAQGEDCKTPCVRIPPLDRDCVGPKSPPWKDGDACQFWYENRFIADLEGGCQIRIVYEHCLRLRGRLQGPLLFSTTLLPSETVTLYTYDRYRRVRSETQRLSVHASLRQTVSALWESRAMQREQRYQEMLVKVRSDDDSTFSIGGMLFPVTWDVEDPDPVSAELLVGQRTETVASQFQQTLQTATQQIEAERSIVVSTFEESEHREATSRTIVNENDCRAVTYYMRRVLECYELVTRVVEISWRGRSPNRKVMGPWRPLDDLGDIDKHCIEFVKRQLEELPRVGEQVTAPRTFTVPTDGTVINAELAHCSSCEPERAARIRIELEQAHSEARRLCAEAELQELEVQRRRALLEQGVFQPFEDLLLIADQAEDNAI